MILGSKVPTCGFDWWEETMQHMMLVANDSMQRSEYHRRIGLPTEFR